MPSLFLANTIDDWKFFAGWKEFQLKGSVLVAPRMVIDEVNKYSSFFESQKILEDFVSVVPHVFEFRHEAAQLVKKIMELMKTDANLVESYAGALTIYYFDKALHALKKAEALLSKINPDQIFIKDVSSVFSQAVLSVAQGLSIPVSFVHPTSWSRFKKILKSGAWFFREFLLSLFPKKANSLKKNGLMILSMLAYHYQKLEVLIVELLKSTELPLTLVLGRDSEKISRIKHPKLNYVTQEAERSAVYFLDLVKNYFSFKKKWLKRMAHLSFQSTPYEKQGPFLKWVLASWFEDHFKRNIRSQLLAKKIVHKLLPQAMVSIDFCDPNIRAYELVAHHSKIPYFCLPFGFFHEKIDTQWCHWKSGQLGAIGPRTAKVLENLSQGSVKVVGDMSYDEFVFSASKSLKDRAQLGYGPKDKIIVFMSFPPNKEAIGQHDGQFSEGIHQLILDTVCEIPKHFKDLNVIIKPHPAESFEGVSQILKDKKYDSQVRVIRDRTSYDLLNLCDMAITVFSTTGLEAILLRKPLIVANFTNMEDLLGCVDSQVAYEARDSVQLYSQIKMILDESGYQKESEREEYLNNYFCSPYQGSAARCKDLILNSL